MLLFTIRVVTYSYTVKYSNLLYNIILKRRRDDTGFDGNVKNEAKEQAAAREIRIIIPYCFFVICRHKTENQILQRIPSSVLSAAF
jgi:hypothetical protein